MEIVILNNTEGAASRLFVPYFLRQALKSEKLNFWLESFCPLGLVSKDHEVECKRLHAGDNLDVLHTPLLCIILLDEIPLPQMRPLWEAFHEKHPHTYRLWVVWNADILRGLPSQNLFYKFRDKNAPRSAHDYFWEFNYESMYFLKEQAAAVKRLQETVATIAASIDKQTPVKV